MVQLIHTDAASAQQHMVKTHDVIAVLNDDELLALLAQIDRPAGLIRTAERVWLTQDVTDQAVVR